jgi:hypothetical protein
MKKGLILTVAAFLLTSCISMEEVQRAMDRIDSTWEVENRKLLKTAGVRVYKISKKKAFQAMTVTLNELGFIVENLDFTTGLILARASSPTPLSKDEWAQIKKVEEPRMQKIAAQEAGEFTASLFILQSNTSEIVANILMLEREADLQISLNFRQKYTGPKTALLYGEQAPPEAVKYGLRKVWDHFERIALIQGKTFN